jgi:hypothetical protein
MYMFGYKQYPQSCLSAAIENGNEDMANYLLQVAPKELVMIPNYVSAQYSGCSVEHPENSSLLSYCHQGWRTLVLKCNKNNSD